ncbi:glycoside hydrolase family 3 N-terminal domain-containing protein [Paradesertivirga mongoliensis]|uniref:beta-glucosidase n=1 Tax=Paradesertivirga mongoliensis TaxID=2100740 RepID=A0ABW4ZNH4_9SPHI|nr:glycoside hydrolase family 3 N-terminal domain-containing protein [Pedobacter mongoliensis]
MRNLITVLLLFLSVVGFAQNRKAYNEIDKKIDKLLSEMTIQEKVGQMTQIAVEILLKKPGSLTEPDELDPEKLAQCIKKYKVGSILNIGITAQTRENWHKWIETIQDMALKERVKIPVLYGIDAIHGNNYTANSVLFPQQIAQAASFNRALVKKAAEITAYETRASFIPWTFSPVLDLGRKPIWSRVYETFGEDPYLVSELGKAMVTGYQGSSSSIDKYHVAACLKHYMGYSMSLTGLDRTPAWIPERELREYFLPSFAAAIAIGAKTVMVNSGEINGVPVHTNKYILTDVLKKELKFKGFALTDWMDIQFLVDRHHVAKDYKEATMMAINAGIDMSMVPVDYTFCDDLVALVNEGKVSMSRIDDAVRRILRVKFDVGLFDNPVGKASDYKEFNGVAHNKTNYEITSECITLLKNTNNLLPLKTDKKILVTGPAANSMVALNGGWSRRWQGTNSDETEKDKNTIYEAIQNVFGSKNVDFAQGAKFNAPSDLNTALSKSEKADVVVLCLGEDSYAETPGNIQDLTLPAAQLELARALKASGKPIVLVLTEGRPRIISAIEPLCSAVIHAYLPGNEGGNVVANVLAGKVNPSGKLPYTYPRYPNYLFNYYRKYTEEVDNSYNPQWEFGYGLSYTTFKYSNLKLSSKVLTEGQPITVSVDITNTGNQMGKESVLLFVSDLVASITPEAKRLRAFEKISLEPGKTQTVTFKITGEQLSFVDATLKRVTEPGEFVVTVGDQKATFNYR